MILPTPYYETELGRLYHGDCMSILKTLPPESANCCVTSPPYWGLRDYGVDGQLGLERTPEEYVSKMVEVFSEVKRVLRGDGTLWLNLGDSYNANGRDGHGTRIGFKQGTNRASAAGSDSNRPSAPGLKPKDLVGIPWMVAFALRTDGWYLRQDIIWHKPNPMPESVTDRCTKAHEYIFLMSKSQRYFYDAGAIKEKATNGTHIQQRFTPTSAQPKGSGRSDAGVQNPICQGGNYDNRNRRSVWTVATAPFPGAHFATFPPKLIEPCILAGCPIGGTVIDPFIGSGTVAIVAHKHDRKICGIELSQKYLDEITIPRIEAERRQLKLF